MLEKRPRIRQEETRSSVFRQPLQPKAASGLTCPISHYNPAAGAASPLEVIRRPWISNRRLQLRIGVWTCIDSQKYLSQAYQLTRPRILVRSRGGAERRHTAKRRELGRSPGRQLPERKSDSSGHDFTLPRWPPMTGRSGDRPAGFQLRYDQEEGGVWAITAYAQNTLARDALEGRLRVLTLQVQHDPAPVRKHDPRLRVPSRSTARPAARPCQPRATSQPR